MADEKLVTRIKKVGAKQAVEEWKSVGKKINLSEMKLRGADLSEADFRLADLRGADLDGTNLSGTDFRSTKGLSETITEERIIQDLRKSWKKADIPKSTY